MWPCNVPPRECAILIYAGNCCAEKLKTLTFSKWQNRGSGCNLLDFMSLILTTNLYWFLQRTRAGLQARKTLKL